MKKTQIDIARHPQSFMRVEMTREDLHDLINAPILLTPEPGANKYFHIDKAVAYIDNDGIASAGGSMQIGYTGTATLAALVPVLSGDARSGGEIVPLAASNAEVYIEQNTSLELQAAAEITGMGVNAKFTLLLWYTAFPLEY